MNTPRKRVVVAGGGTAGWLAATALVRQLSGLIDVTLVESEEIGTVGVGESTIPTIRTFHEFIGVQENDFVRATHATFKLGIGFENWDRLGDHYFHPFGSVGRSTFVADFQHFWLEGRKAGFGGDYGDYSLEQQAAMAGRFGASGDNSLGYAYHLDASAYARFLRGVAEGAGARRVEGRIASVEQDGESGDITALVLASGERIEGDLFIDCTGFRGLLIEQTLKTGFEDWSHWLPTDSAFAVQSEATGDPVPYTRAIAHGEGWRWRIPLQHRVGNGIVYDSNFLSDGEARDRLLQSLDGPPLFEPRLLRFTAGMRKRVWNRNCLSLGLASGFVEPLESTSIHLVMVAVTWLIQNFPFGPDNTAVADWFNARSRHEWEHVRDFIVLHYAMTHRDDTAFWRERAAAAIPDSLAARIQLFREAAIAYQSQDDLFRVDSWVAVLIGQGVWPERHHQLPAMLPKPQLQAALNDLRRNIVGAVERMPSHAARLAQIADETREREVL
ncbi:tryptophan halogenase [Novosphingobium sp. PhB165]|uniref:tryptophan halogenase family protein n=1 Tax=Novosphingobium sp. PhB165 TaxID=2485105 RepID=UPI00104F34D9|nr:tryptophan halogenase family protein [Novosphingobium sp. PhB165]TCM20540.1 tryptophan halogenase [Novosphingobium sp. PhB165]